MNKQRIIDSTPSDMHERDAIIRFAEGLKVAASCAKEMHQMFPKQGWDKVRQGLKALSVSGLQLAKRKAVTRQQLIADSWRIQKKLDTNEKSA